MLVQTTAVSEKVYNKIHDDHKHGHFIICVTSLVSGLPPNNIESMLFCISFLENGKPSVDEHQQRVWILGHIMASLVRYANKTIKFVFDETIVHKERWCSRALLSHVLSQASDMNENMIYDDSGPIQS